MKKIKKKKAKQIYKDIKLKSYNYFKKLFFKHFFNNFLSRVIITHLFYLKVYLRKKKAAQIHLSYTHLLFFK